MIIAGISYTTNSEGKRNYTLYVMDDFDPYYKNVEAGRGCSGQKVESIYVGTYDCSQMKAGDRIDVLYDKAVTTKNGLYQPVKKILVAK